VYRVVAEGAERGTVGYVIPQVWVLPPRDDVMGGHGSMGGPASLAATGVAVKYGLTPRFVLVATTFHCPALLLAVKVRMGGASAELERRFPFLGCAPFCYAVECSYSLFWVLPLA
jgi:hypothetical protein